MGAHVVNPKEAPFNRFPIIKMRKSMDTEEVAYKKELLRAHERRVRELELRKASLGANCPPEVKTEVEDIHNTIAMLRKDIEVSNKQLINGKEINQKTILYIDDESVMLNFIERQLTKEG